jgi:NhaP-type Na+/H+ or K+/H+ antiporter
MVLDFYTFFLPLLFFVLLGIELYARKGKRWGGRLATMAILVGSTFVLVWIMKWLELIPHRVPLP